MFTVYHENLPTTFRTQRDALPYAASIATADLGATVPIYNAKMQGTSYVRRTETGTYHIKTDRRGYETTYTRIDA